jgi:acetolactate synthase-1/2/3 large subunit
VADYIADFIYRRGVKEVFMLAGGGSIYLDDGVACHKHLKHICVRNETTAPMMAGAYARVAHNLGVVYVTTGPGGTNAISGVIECWTDSVPILVISGQVSKDHILEEGPRAFGVQGFNIIKMVKPVTKYCALVRDPNEIRYHLEKSFNFAKNGRPGPVWLDIPLDVQNAVVDESSLRGYEGGIYNFQSSVCESQSVEILKLLRHSKRPVIIAGQGVKISDSIHEFRRLVEHLDIPVVFTRLSADVLPFSHKNSFGCAGITGRKSSNLILKNSDLVISLGCRLAPPLMGENSDIIPHTAKLIAVDIDFGELEKHKQRIDLRVEGDAKGVILDLLNKTESVQLPSFREWMETCTNHKNKYPTTVPEDKRNPLNLYYFIQRVDVLSKPNTIFITNAGTSYHIAEQVLQFEKGQREITSGAMAAMGLAIPFAIGSSVADKSAQVVVLTGDGSLELNIEELKTISYYNLNVKAFIMNNGGYVTIKNTQDRVCSGRYIGSMRTVGTETLDLQKVAAAFDLPYCRIDRWEDVDEKVAGVLDRDGPVFIDVVCDRNQKLIESFA